MSIINALTPNELEMFECYREHYSGDSNCSFIPSDELLNMAWAPQKERYLYPLLNNSLIYHEQITYELDEERILDGIYKLFSNVNSATSQFVNEFNAWRDANEMTLKETGSEWYINFLFSPPVLAQNVYNGLTFYVNCPNDKVVKVQQGCRPVKTLLKILNMWGGLPHQDAFREEVSRVLTQKKLQGTLSLSIHPLDYATMSDNENDWSSCMSWQEDGCYRAGTVEMMNSEAVVVAYLSNRDMEMPGGTWNSKMWRQLFVVSPKGIFGVKAYPYQNEHLTDAALHALANLAEKNLGWEFDENVIAFNHGDWFKYAHVPGGEEHDYCLQFKTNAMYNDFGTITHRGIIASTWDGNKNEDGSAKKFIFNYSGPRQCMCCGELNSDFGDTVDLLCENCNGVLYCAHCGERIYDGDQYYVDGEYYCEYCFDNYAEYDRLDEDYHLSDNMVPVYVLPRDFTEEEIEALGNYRDWINRYQFPKFNTYYTNVDAYWNTYFKVKPVKFYDSGYSYYILEQDATDVDELSYVIKECLEYRNNTELPDPRINME